LSFYQRYARYAESGIEREDIDGYIYARRQGHRIRIKRKIESY